MSYIYYYYYYIYLFHFWRKSLPKSRLYHFSRIFVFIESIRPKSEQLFSKHPVRESCKTNFTLRFGEIYIINFVDCVWLSFRLWWTKIHILLFFLHHFSLFFTQRIYTLLRNRSETLTISNVLFSLRKL